RPDWARPLGARRLPAVDGAGYRRRPGGGALAAHRPGRGQVRLALPSHHLYAWERYHRPIAITETSGYQDHRAAWLRMTMEECMKALNAGIDLQGVCLYPCVDIPDWNTGEWARIGVYDVRDEKTLERCPCDDYIEELRRWQQRLEREERLEPEQLAENVGR